VTATLAVRTLKADEKQHVTYAAPMWLRDEQIARALKRGVGRLQEPTAEQRAARAKTAVAVVGFGPSLTDTWELVRQFPHVITCSGSHKFLLERGIVPTYHVEVDPRAHKVGLLGPPHPAVHYLAASTCAPEYFDHLETGLGPQLFADHVLLWHVFDGTEEGKRVLPFGEWAVLGGCDVGLRAMALAAFLGYTELHIFGLDGCARGDVRHAAAHPYTQQKYAECEYPEGSGTVYLTTPAMLEAARQTIHELAQLPAVRAKFYGEGLTQALVRHSIVSVDAAKRSLQLVAFIKEALISPEYRRLNAELHDRNLAYGVGGEKHAENVLKMCTALKTKDVLDYGCGKGRLAKALPFHIQEYDPAIAGKDESPKPADIVVCTDVLEHIEPDKLLYVLYDLRRVVRLAGFFVIHTGPAQKTLPDGRNTHLIQQPRKWWEKRLRKFFTIGKVEQVGPELLFVVGPKITQVA